MAETTFRSARVLVREIDTSSPSAKGIQGVPAGVIGTANEGPAFVPIVFGNLIDFENIFGEIDGSSYGQLAVNEWLKNAAACSYIRVLGIGDGKQRNTSTGVVTNAGFFVGEKSVQENGYVGDNIYANTGEGSVKGRTYFLGCLMSESNGSTIFSDTGIQAVNSKALLKLRFAGGPIRSGSFTLKDASGTAYIFSSSTGDADITSEGSNVYRVGAKSPSGNGIMETAKTIAERYYHAILTASAAGLNIAATTSPAEDTEQENDGYSFFVQQLSHGIIGNTAVDSSILTASQIQFTGSLATSLSGTISSSFAGGAGGSIPILRGVLLAPSGVILHLSSAFGTPPGLGHEPSLTAAAAADDDTISGQKGSLTGSYNMRKREFVMVMNGFKGSDIREDNHITASFDMANSDGDASNYFVNVFNKGCKTVHNPVKKIAGNINKFNLLTV